MIVNGDSGNVNTDSGNNRKSVHVQPEQVFTMNRNRCSRSTGMSVHDQPDYAEFLVPMALTQGQLAEAMGVSRKTVNELCTNRRAITADTALMLATVFGNTTDFWLNLQQRNDLWKALNTPKRRTRIDKAKPIAA